MDKEILALCEQAHHIVVGVSGGRDSMILLDVLKPYYHKLSVAHVNYKLRANADLEEKLVQEHCHHLGIACATLIANNCFLEMPNLEAHTRRIRYHFYQECAEKNKASLVLIAHHSSDLAESIFLRLLRGSSYLYLKKLRPLTPDIMIGRPLINWTPEDMRSYANDHQITWREDESNQHTYYLRNFLRHEILPHLEDKVPHLRKRLQLLSSLREEEEDLLEKVTVDTLKQLGEQPKSADFLKLHPGLQRRILAFWCENRKIKAPGVHEVKEIIRKLSNSTKGMILLEHDGYQLIQKKSCLIWTNPFVSDT